MEMSLVKALRLTGHDISAIVEEQPGSTDEQVISRALAEEQILLTEDRDFGRLVYAHMRGSSGVIYIRYPAGARSELERDLLDLVGREAESLAGAFSVMQPGRTRISRLPEV